MAPISISSNDRAVAGRLPRLAIGALSLLLAVLAATPVARPDGVAQREYAEKARFLGTFAKFVEWPSTAFSDDTSPIVIGILGSDPFGYALERSLQGQTAGGRRLAVKRFADVSRLELCSILFVSKAIEKELPKILERLAGSAVLTVGDTQGFVERGGIIGFLFEDGHVRFKVNPAAAEHAGLKISSRLLVVAKIAPDSRQEPK